eukprot:gene34317-46034_t
MKGKAEAEHADVHSHPDNINEKLKDIEDDGKEKTYNYYDDIPREKRHAQLQLANVRVVGSKLQSSKVSTSNVAIDSTPLCRVKRVMPQVLRYAVPVIAIALVFASITSFPHYAFAAAAKKKAIAASSTAAAATAAEAAKSSPPFIKIINKMGKIAQKIIYGVNSKAASRMLKKAGDTRAEISGLINAVTMVITLGAWAAVASVLSRREEASELQRMRKEVLREQEYKENMYFEAVEQIIAKLTDPKLKGSVRADLSKQLKDLDPDGRIRDFLDGKSTRPNLSDLISK